MYTNSVGVAPVSSAGQVGTTGAPGRRATPFCYAPSPSRASRSHLGRTGASKVSAGTWLVPAPVGVRQRPCHPRTRGKRNKQNKAAIMVANAACRSAAIGLRYIRSREGGGDLCKREISLERTRMVEGEVGFNPRMEGIEGTGKVLLYSEARLYVEPLQWPPLGRVPGAGWQRARVHGVKATHLFGAERCQLRHVDVKYVT